MTHALVTGPGISGAVTLPDGRTFDVSAPILYLPDIETVRAVNAAIAARYTAEGHPLAPGFTPDAQEG